MKLFESKKVSFTSSFKQTLGPILPTKASDSIFSRIQDCASDHCAALQTLALADASTASATSGAYEKSGAGQYSVTPDCIPSKSKTCPSIDPSTVHERAKTAAETIYAYERFSNWISSFFMAPEFTDVQEFLRFRKDDLREKFLFLVAEADYNGALNPSLIAGVLGQLSQTYDLKYGVITKPEQICDAIRKSSAKVGKISHVLIQGHGNAYGTHLFGPNVQDNYFSADNNINPYYCFNGIKTNGRIILASCSTGAQNKGDPFDNVAAKIANFAKRSVVAPTIDTYPAITDLLSEDFAPMLYHPQKMIYSLMPFYNRNVFLMFSPNFTRCHVKAELHDRERKAVETIVQELTSKSILPFSKTFNATQRYLGLCVDDPRDKALYFSAQDDINGALDPSYEISILGPLADQFDLQYQVTDSFENVCKVLRDAAKVGPVKVLIIHAHGTPKEGLLFSKTKEGQEKRLTVTSDVSCLSKVAPDGTIAFIGGSVGQSISKSDTLAQRVANIAQHVVLAATCPLYGESIVAKSLDPLILQHSGHSYLRNLIFLGCPENNDELFKIFLPK